MPGPDDTLKFLQKYATDKGYILDVENVEPGELSQLRREAEALHSAQRGLDALMRLYLQKAEPATAEMVDLT